jgi:hypothetical protein
MNRELIDQLRAVNPVANATPVGIEDVWRKLDESSGRDADIAGLVPGRRARVGGQVIGGGKGSGPGLAGHGTDKWTRVRVRATDKRRSRVGGAVALASSIAIVAAVIAVVLVGHGGSSPKNGLSPAGRSATSTNSQALARVDPRVAVEFSVLTSPPKPGDALPAADKAALSPYRAQSPDVSGSRRVTASNGQAAYLLPSKLGACAVSAFAPICAPASSLPAAFSLDLCSPTLPVGRIEMQWLLPDGATNVTVRMANGTLLSFASGYNVYIATIRNTGWGPRSINWDQHGQHQSVIVGPLAGRSGRCEHPNNVPSASQLPTTPPGAVTTSAHRARLS